MKYNFRLPDFPNSNFEIETSIWTGKSRLFMDNKMIEQSKEKGRPFLIPKTNNEFIKAFPKRSFPDVVPLFEINGIKIHILEKLKWFQYALCGLPILLVIVGGAIGGLIGAIGYLINYNIFRQEGTQISKYLKVVGIIASSYILFFLIAEVFKNFGLWRGIFTIFLIIQLVNYVNDKKVAKIKANIEANGEERTVISEKLIVYNKTHESLGILTELENGTKYSLYLNSDFDRFYKVRLVNGQIGYILKPS
jgi:hypothetical protein